MPNTPHAQTLELCRTLARLQAIIAEDRVTGEDDDCIAACGTVINYLAQEWGLDKDWLWVPSHMHDLEGLTAEEIQARVGDEEASIKLTVDQIMAMLLATGQAPTELRSTATRQFGDLLREEGFDVT